jgi:hypothetical protein
VACGRETIKSQVATNGPKFSWDLFSGVFYRTSTRVPITVQVVDAGSYKTLFQNLRSPMYIHTYVG